jgi:hypothetical protein
MAATTSNVHFACLDCKVYVDAGYRWAVWQLEEAGLVIRGQCISIERLFSARDYWIPPRSDSSYWLEAEVLPAARRFLDEHKCHRVVYGGTADFLSPQPDDILNWMQVGFLPVLLPRYFVERLGFETWEQVAGFVAHQDSAPWWWMLEWDGLHDKARKKFQELVNSRSSELPVSRTCAKPAKCV